MNLHAASIGSGREAAGSASWQEAVPTTYRRPLAVGLSAVLGFCAMFGIWAVSAPISGAVIAGGVVQASGSNQVIDHLEGGIIATIDTREGESVRQGQILVTLDATRVEAERNRVIVALHSVEAQIARAEAERDGRSELRFSPELEVQARLDNSFSTLEEQSAEFRNRLERHMAELSAIDQQIAAAGQEIEGLSIQKEAEERKLALLREELADKQGLLKKGLTPRSQVQALQRAEADSLGAIGAIAASIGQRQSTIAELGERKAGLQATRRESASTQINDLRSRSTDLREQLRAREDILARSQIKAPADGVIVKLSKNTVGSTLKAGEPVAELLPTRRNLQIEARVAPADVDAVKIGQPAILRLVALNARKTPDVAARVTFLSADRIVDAASREAFYTIRLAIDGDLPAGVDPSRIYPGMPVEALVQTGDRTFLEYLVRPIQDSFAKAFREE